MYIISFTQCAKCQFFRLLPIFFRLYSLFFGFFSSPFSFFVHNFFIFINAAFHFSKNSSTKKYDGNYIFYVSRDKDKLENEQYKTKSSDTLEQVDEMIKKLTGKAIPKKVIVNSYNLLDGILTLDFSE